MGRKKGSLKRIKLHDSRQQIADRVHNLLRTGYTPLEFLIKTYRDEKLDMATRLDAGKAAALYTHAKPAQEVKQEITGQFSVTFEVIGADADG